VLLLQETGRLITSPPKTVLRSHDNVPMKGKAFVKVLNKSAVIVNMSDYLKDLGVGARASVTSVQGAKTRRIPDARQHASIAINISPRMVRDEAKEDDPFTHDFGRAVM
jgi:hypothetical protein